MISFDSHVITHDQFSPPLVMTKLDQVLVVRDDLLPGGTKQRACAPYLKLLMNEGHENFFYASPFSGFAQVALSYVCKVLNIECTIVCEKDQRFPHLAHFHPFSQKARANGAKLVMAQSLPEAEEIASVLAENSFAGFKLPLGFDSDHFRQELHRELSTQWNELELSHKVKRVWLPVGSGTLARTFNGFLPKHIELNCVNVHVLEESDPRISQLKNFERIKMFKAPMAFHEPATDHPRIPSNIFYDAKIWNFLREQGREGDLWWNVAQ